ncbi:GNAT family N-acetyltransferase [Fusibacter sp. 3D3]|uniref:GNAT family N-acetyltransferase n=1 Tax=Fusibacter sp. 3D3 TaxID=1048380 RepID=UPI0008536313|nr:GNAT family N-acetyltransferase [Fusibacter sp. 3D3]GAU79143.1 acetyltransferase [Fusibacter sp. 3D3]
MARDKITLVRLLKDDLIALEQFFRLCIQTVMINEGFEDIEAFVNEEVVEKMNFVQSDLYSNGDKHFFLIAKKEREIVGTIAYGPAGDLIDQLSEGAYKAYGEIGSVFVHPERHNQGIGSLMLNAMYLALMGRGIKTFCLDSGYTIAKQIWTGKFGEPNIISKDQWGEGYDHYIWKINLDQVTIEI